MKTAQKVSIERLGIGVGAITSLGLILYFMLMNWLDLVFILELRFFNFVILAAGIVYALNRYRSKKHQKKITYLRGIGLGAITTVAAAGIFSLFLFIYLTQFDRAFMSILQEDAWFGYILTPVSAAYAVLIEGLASGMVITFIAMQFFKREPNENWLRAEEKKNNEAMADQRGGHPALSGPPKIRPTVQKTHGVDTAEEKEAPVFHEHH